MTPEPTDKLDATTTVAVNGPEDAPLRVDWSVRPYANGPGGLA